MSTATITVGAGLDSALRREFSNASIRLAPDARMTDIIAALQSMGVTASLTDGVVVLDQAGTQMHTTLALRNFAKMPQHERFIVKQGQHPRTWTTKEKSEYISKNGLEKYEQLISGPVLDAGVRVLDANMDRQSYENLTTRERVQFIREFGEEGVRRVMSKPRKAASK